MKKLFTILLLSFSCMAAFGQFEWVYENSGQANLNKMVGTVEGGYALFHNNGILTVLNGSGNKRFDYFAGPLGNNVTVSFIDIIDMPYYFFSLLADIIIFDPMTGNASGYQAILQLDDNGTLINTFEITNLYAERGTSLLDGSYILMGLTYPGILKKAINGDDLWEKSLLGYDIYDMAITIENTILIATAQGLLTLDEDGNETGLHSGFVFDQVKVDWVGWMDGIVGTMGDSIFLLSPDYSLLASTGFAGDNIKDFSVEGNKVAVLTESGQVCQYDSLLTFLDSFQLFNDGEFDFIAIGPERLVLAGIEQYGGPDNDNGTRTVFAKEYSFEGDDYGISNDIGVAGIEQGAETEVTEINPTYYTVAFQDVKITVRNYGNNPVENLYLRTKQSNRMKFENLNLLPGEEVDLIWDEIKFSFSTNPAGLTLDLCLWTSHPDLLMDLDASNDSYCTDFLVNSKDILAHNSFKLYPNPAHGMLNMQWNGQIASNDAICRIINIEGKLIKQMGIDLRQGIASIPVENWPSGVYFVQLFDGGGESYSERFLVVK